MDRKKRRIEALKSVLIVLLFVLFVVLALLDWLYDVETLPEGLRQPAVKIESALGLYAGGAVTVEESRAETYGEAAIPVSAAVTLSGGRYAALGRESQQARRLYARLAPVIGEAAGSAGEFKEITRREWRAALSAEGIYFRLSDELPFRLLSLGLGVSRETGPELDRLLLAPGENGVTLFAASEERAYRAETSASAEALRSLMEDFSRGEAADWQQSAGFSFERGLAGELLTAGAADMPRVSVSVPTVSEPAFEGYLSLFSINPHTNYRYTTAEGLRRAVDVSRVLELSEGGELRYRDAAGDHGIEIDAASLPRMIEQLRRIAAGTVGACAGDGALTLRSYQQEDGRAVVCFGCTVAGAAVYPQGREAAAVFVVEHGVLTRAEMLLRRYAIENDDLVLIPESRAQALAGGPCEPAYFDSGDGCTPRWCAAGARGQVAA